MSYSLSKDMTRAKGDTDYPNDFWLRVIAADQQNYSGAKTSHLKWPLLASPICWASLGNT
jgi:hypothetical protein